MSQQQQQKEQNSIKKLPTTRKRSHSSSSSSSDSPSLSMIVKRNQQQMFSPSPSATANSSSDSSSSLALTSNSALSSTSKKKRSVPSLNPTLTRNSGNSTDSSAESNNTSSSQLPMLSSSSSSSSTFNTTPNSSIVPPRLTAQRSVPAFLNKLYNMVEDITTNDLIRWSTSGASFIVEKHEEFAKTVLPRFYKHNTFASFVRQLNMYDFHKVPHLQQGVLVAESEHEKWEFSNPHFQRGRPDLLVLVTRKRNRDRDTTNDMTNDNLNLVHLTQDVVTLKKQQTILSNELKDLHRDNEILWQETLNGREKYQHHQEAIEKILQFLTAIFANDNLAISMNNTELLPKGLIEEAASLAGITTSKSVNNDLTATGTSSNSTALLPNSLATSALSNILSSVLQLQNDNSQNGTNAIISPALALADKSTIQQQYHQQQQQQRNLKEKENRPQQPCPSSQYNSTNSIETPSSPLSLYTASPNVSADDGNKTQPNLVDFSKTLNTATRSAQSITQDIDMLQVNIESLANGLGIDPNQFDDENMEQYFPSQNDTSYNLIVNTDSTYPPRAMTNKSTAIFHPQQPSSFNFATSSFDPTTSSYPQQQSQRRRSRKPLQAQVRSAASVNPLRPTSPTMPSQQQQQAPTFVAMQPNFANNTTSSEPTMNDNTNNYRRFHMTTPNFVSHTTANVEYISMNLNPNRLPLRANSLPNYYAGEGGLEESSSEAAASSSNANEIMNPYMMRSSRPPYYDGK
ncbi:MAG: hypothetical protein EXX96DRAFT_251079 [Benjaminiella poitrasii]|nr:MAG: hypothetical protein EXX96DRAFT_251079 [Benjaminiella poitrasii]